MNWIIWKSFLRTKRTSFFFLFVFFSFSFHFVLNRTNHNIQCIFNGAKWFPDIFFLAVWLTFHVLFHILLNILLYWIFHKFRRFRIKMWIFVSFLNLSHYFLQFAKILLSNESFYILSHVFIFLHRNYE